MGDHLTLKYALKKINLSTAGVCFVTKKKKILNVITDGDIRRALIKGYKLSDNIKEIKSKRNFIAVKNNHNFLDLQDKITKYCKTSNPNYNAPCDSPNGLYKPFKDKAAVKVKTKEWVPGYFPNLGFKKGEGTLTSIGYLEEVVERANGVTCLT